MDNVSFILTKNELEVMELLWTLDKALSRSEIIELSPERSWKKSSVHILLNSMLNKGAIRVDGYVRTGKNYGRTYSAAVTREEYQVIQFKYGMPPLTRSSAMADLISALIMDEDIDDETLDKLEATLQARRDEKK